MKIDFEQQLAILFELAEVKTKFAQRKLFFYHFALNEKKLNYKFEIQQMVDKI